MRHETAPPASQAEPAASSTSSTQADRPTRERFVQDWLKAVWQPLQAPFHKLQRDGKVRKDLSADALARIFVYRNATHLVTRYVLASQPGLAAPA